MARAVGASEGMRRDIESIVESALKADLVALKLEAEQRDASALRVLAPLLENWRPRDARGQRYPR